MAIKEAHIVLARCPPVQPALIRHPSRKAARPLGTDMGVPDRREQSKIGGLQRNRFERNISPVPRL